MEPSVLLTTPVDTVYVNTTITTQLNITLPPNLPNQLEILLAFEAEDNGTELSFCDLHLHHLGSNIITLYEPSAKSQFITKVILSYFYIVFKLHEQSSN